MFVMAPHNVTSQQTGDAILGMGNNYTTGPSGWDQLVNISGRNPYYVPNPFVISAGIWLVCCFGITGLVVLAVRRSKNKCNPITESLSGWRYRAAIFFASLAFLWAIFDDTYVLINIWASQRLFLAQFIFQFFWDLAKVALLLSVYDLFYRLMQESPLGNGTTGQVHFWKFKSTRNIFCGSLALLAFLMMCLRCAYLTVVVFHPTVNGGEPNFQHESIVSVAEILCYMFDISYLLAGLEFVTVASILMYQRKRKPGSGCKAVYTHNLLFIASPILVSAIFTLASTFIRPPPSAPIGGIFGNGTGINAPLAALQFTATVLAGPGIILPLGGMVTVAQRADATIDRIERLNSDSLDRVLVQRRQQPQPEVSQVALARPASSNYDEPQSWGGSTMAA